jgi:hypothetical protein
MRLRQEIERERRVRESLFAQVTNTLEDDLPSIIAELNEAQGQFRTEEEEVVASCEGMLEECENSVKEFTAEQENNTNKVFDLIRELTKKVKA